MSRSCRRPAVPKNVARVGLSRRISGLILASRQATVRSVNSILTATAWSIGRQIVLHEQGGRHRAAYGAAILEYLNVALEHEGTKARRHKGLKGNGISGPYQRTANQQTDEITNTDLFCRYPGFSLCLCVKKANAGFRIKPAPAWAGMARYALDNLPNRVMASEYRLHLPEESILAGELRRVQARLGRGEACRSSQHRPRKGGRR